MSDDLLGGEAQRPPMRVPGSHMDRRVTPAEEGSPRVTEILAGVTDVNSLPVHERVIVFERVHEELRRSLDVDASNKNAGRE